MGFSYRCCFSCVFFRACSICGDIMVHENYDLWEIAEICSFYLPRKLSLLDKIIIIAAWLLR